LQKKSAVSNSKKRKRDSPEGKNDSKSNKKSSRIDTKSSDPPVASEAPSGAVEFSETTKKEIKSTESASKRAKVASAPKKRQHKVEKDEDFSESSSPDDDVDGEDQQDPDPGKMFADHDIYDDEDDGSVAEPKSADAKLVSKLPTPFSSSTMPNVPIPMIIKSSPPPSPTKVMRSPSKSAAVDGVQQRLHREKEVAIHDRPTPSKLSLSSLLHDVQERAVEMYDPPRSSYVKFYFLSDFIVCSGSPVKHAPVAFPSSPAMQPPSSSLSPPVARRSLMSAIEDSMQSSDGMVTLEIESSQDANSRSGSPAPPQFLRTSNQLLSDNSMNPFNETN
jgi:hypothetical protein